MDYSEDIKKFLISNIPQFDSILVGCKIDKQLIPHECCEYDIISVYDEKSINSHGITLKKDYKILGEGKNIYEALILSRQDFINNQKIQYMDYIYFPGQTFNNREIRCFQKKSEGYQKTFRFLLKKNIIKNIYDITNSINLLSKSGTDENLISFYLKMISFNTIKNFIHFYLNTNHRPSHLKYQINLIKESQDLKTKERVDLLIDFIGIERANISSLSRSEKSLKFMVRNCKQRNYKIMFGKLDFFLKKSMYVDGYLLIHNFIQNQNFDSEFITNYNNLLNYIVDIKTKEKITMLKEANLLLEFNKNLI